MTVRDFAQVFDAYAKFEEAIISRLMSSSSSSSGEEENEEDLAELDFRLAYFERLMDRRPFLLNDVVLRQNPNNVNEWLKRIAMALETENINMLVEAYQRAVSTIDPKKAQGKFPDIWIQYARYEAAAGNMQGARDIFEQAVQIDFSRA